MPCAIGVACPTFKRKPPRDGIIRGMKKRAMNAMFEAALSIFAVAAPCMASDAFHPLRISRSVTTALSAAL